MGVQIRTFANTDTERVFWRTRRRRFSPELERAAWKKLAIVHAAGSLQDMRMPPGNRLEMLTGAREGQNSVRINEIVHGKRAITSDTALRLARYFGMTETFWVNLQAHYDLEIERDRLGDRLETEVRVHAKAG